jgi:hypothetical protein
MPKYKKDKIDYFANCRSTPGLTTPEKSRSTTCQIRLSPPSMSCGFKNCHWLTVGQMSPSMSLWLLMEF